MAEDELQTVRLRTDFYRDGFPKIVVAIAMIIAAILSLIVLFIYLFITKPDPVSFATDTEYRIVAPVPIDQQYLTDPDLYQWISRAITIAFSYDFLSYNVQQHEAAQYFTPNGWDNLLGHLNNYRLDFRSLQNTRMFVSAEITGAPFILNKGLIEGKFAWYVQIPLNLSYSKINSTRSLIIVAKVVRISTVDNLNGVAIENLSITSPLGNQGNING